MNHVADIQPLSPTLSVVVVNINRRHLLERCLRSVDREAGDLPLEVIVVDNDSADGSPEMVHALFPHVRLLRTHGLRGFAENYNTGIRAAAGRYILILNNDAELLPLEDPGQALPAMVARLQQVPGAGCLGPMLVSPEGRLQFECARAFPSAGDWAIRVLWLDKLFPRSKLFARFNMTYWDHASERFVDCVLGACMLLPRRVFDRVGLFDERFFLMAEDIDLCKRLAGAGLRVLYAPRFRVMHVGDQTVRARTSYAGRIESVLSIYKYYRKHRGAAYAWLFRCIALILLIPKILLAENRLVGHLLGRSTAPLPTRLAACASLLAWRSHYTGERA